MSLFINFILIMQVFVLKSFQWQDILFLQVDFQLSDKIN